MFYINKDYYLAYPEIDRTIEEKIGNMNSYIKQLLNENEKLKKELEEANKKLYLCTPELPQNVHGNHVSYVDLVNKIYELKKQLTRGKWVKESRKQIEDKLIEDIDNVETLNIILNHLDSLYFSIDNQLYKIKKYKTQQQDFIKYLEDEIKEKEMVKNNNNNDLIAANIANMELEILKKIFYEYKKIIQKEEE